MKLTLQLLQQAIYEWRGRLADCGRRGGSLVVQSVHEPLAEDDRRHARRVFQLCPLVHTMKMKKRRGKGLQACQHRAPHIINRSMQRKHGSELTAASTLAKVG